MKIPPMFLSTINRYRHSASVLGTGKFAPDKRTHKPDGLAYGTANIVGASTNFGKNPSSTVFVKKSLILKRNQLVDMVNADPATWGIHAMQRRLITQTPWDVVPDLSDKWSELDRLEDLANNCINEYDYFLLPKSTILPFSMVYRISNEVEIIVKNTDEPHKQRKRIASFFRLIKDEVQQDAMLMCHDIKARFLRPNNHMETSYRALLELIVRDLQLDDAGIMIKNYDGFGKLAELWHCPGFQVIPMVNPDFTVPKSPDFAYLWQDSSKVLSWFTNTQLSYMMANPTGFGVGMAPIEVLAWGLTASILGNQKIIEQLQQGYLPNMIMNLKGANKPQRDTFEMMLKQKINAQGAGDNILVVSGVPSEDGQMQVIDVPRGVDFAKMQMSEYMKADPGMKAFVHGFQPSDLGLILSKSGAANDPDTTDMLSTRRAIRGPQTLIEEFNNREVIQQEFNTTDVVFKFLVDGPTSNPLDQSRADSVDIASGVLSRNDVRRSRKLRPVPGGNNNTTTTGNAIILVDALEEWDESQLDANGNPVAPTSDPGIPVPVATGDAKKRNNAGNRATMQGHASRGGPPLPGK